jgi:hypothetical protein
MEIRTAPCMQKQIVGGTEIHLAVISLSITVY